MNVSIIDSNLQSTVKNAIATFHANMKKSAGTKSNAILLETQSEELFMLIKVCKDDVPIILMQRYGLNTLEYKQGLKKMQGLINLMITAINDYQQEYLAILKS